MEFKREDIEWLVNLCFEHELTELTVGSVSIKQSEQVLLSAKQDVQSVEAQGIATNLMNISDDQLLDNPFHGLDEALEAVDTGLSQPKAKEG